MVADQPARKADQNWREGRQPWPIRNIPTGRSCGLARDVHRNPFADCPAASSDRAGMREQRLKTVQSVTAEVRLDPAKSAHFSGSVPSNDRLTASIPAAGAIYDCPNPPTGRSCPRNRRESGECRFMHYSFDLWMVRTPPDLPWCRYADDGL